MSVKALEGANEAAEVGREPAGKNVPGGGTKKRPSARRLGPLPREEAALLARASWRVTAAEAGRAVCGSFTIGCIGEPGMTTEPSAPDLREGAEFGGAPVLEDGFDSPAGL